MPLPPDIWRWVGTIVQMFDGGLGQLSSESSSTTATNGQLSSKSSSTTATLPPTFGGHLYRDFEPICVKKLSTDIFDILCGRSLREFLLLFNIAILQRSLFFVNRAFMTLFDNLNIHFVVLGAGALQRKHIFLCSILERTKGGKKAYLILPPPPLQPFNASRGEITGFPLRRRQPAFISGKKVPLSRVSSFSLYFAFQSHPFLFAPPGGRILAGLFCLLVGKCVS